MTKIKNVCVFASSSNYLKECYYKDASELGRLLGMSGMNIVYGGSRLGLMYECAKEVKQYGGGIIGVMPQKLYDLGVGNPDDCIEFHITSGIRERKAKMDEISDASIALAGGFGTLEELSEIIVQKQLDYNRKPVILINTNGFYNKLTEFFDEIIAGNFARETNKNLYYVADTPQDAVNYLKTYTPSKAEEKIYSR